MLVGEERIYKSISLSEFRKEQSWDDAHNRKPMIVHPLTKNNQAVKDGSRGEQRRKKDCNMSEQTKKQIEKLEGMLQTAKGRRRKDIEHCIKVLRSL